MTSPNNEPSSQDSQPTPIDKFPKRSAPHLGNWPEPIHDALDALVDSVLSEPRQVTRTQLVAALILNTYKCQNGSQGIISILNAYEDAQILYERD